MGSAWGQSLASLRVKINISRRPIKKAKNACCTKRSLFFRPVPVASQLEGGTVVNKLFVLGGIPPLPTYGRCN